ncbi:UNVERIFIED_CONTAM: hypothetical protein NCL1_61705 [Trichonephila clavipes]
MTLMKKEKDPSKETELLLLDVAKKENSGLQLWKEKQMN